MSGAKRKRRGRCPQGGSPAGTFTSADGSVRCRRCHLHPDLCTCRPEHPFWQVFGPIFGVGPGREPNR